jgi:hypothetical protein
MLTTMLVLALGAPPMTDQRSTTRVRAGIAAAATAGYALGNDAVGYGPGLSAELGATVADKFSLVMRVTMGTLHVGTVTAGVALDIAFSDRCSFGVGVALGYIGGVFVTDHSRSLSATLPVRIAFAPWGRGQNDVARVGMLIFVEVVPGGVFSSYSGFAGIAPRSFGPPLSIAAAIGVGLFRW